MTARSTASLELIAGGQTAEATEPAQAEPEAAWLFWTVMQMLWPDEAGAPPRPVPRALPMLRRRAPQR